MSKIKVEKLIADVKVLRLQPGDCLVFQCEGGVDDVVISRIRQEFNTNLGFKIGVLGMGTDDKVSVIRKAARKEMAKTDG